MHTEPKPTRVLHVDDNPEFTTLVADMLEGKREYLTVDTTTTPETVPDRLATTEYDCLVSDYDMPELTGIEILKTVREDYPELPVILFTGKGSEQVASEAISAGVTDYLQKGGGTEQYELLANRIENAVAQRQAQQQATQASQRHAPLFEELGEPALEVSVGEATTTIERVNDAFEATFDREAAQLRDELANDRPVPDDEASPVAAIRNGELSEKGEHTELRYQTADGHRWFLLRTVPFTVDSEQRAYVIYIDITDRKHQQQRFEAFLEHSTDIISVLSPDGSYQYQSPSSETVIGYTPEELYEQNAFDFIHPDDRDRVLEEFQAAIADPEITPTVQYRAMQKDGSWRWLESTGNNQLDNPAIEGFVVNTHDITERKQREQELRESEQRYRNLLATSPVPILIYSTDGVLQYGNDAAADLFGVDSCDQLVGRSVGSLAHPDSMRTVAQRHRQLIEDDEPVPPTEIKIVDTAGDVRHMLVAADTTTYEGAPAVQTVATDITEQKQRQRELEQQNQRLDELASVLSHDLKNPLNVAEGRLGLARNGGPDADGHFDAVTRALERMNTLVDDLTTLARAGDRVDDPEPVDLDAVVTESWDTVAAPDATYTCATEQTVSADRSRLRQLVENLLDNAVEHSSGDVRIRVGDLEDGFYVADDGPGIPPDERDEVFDPGYSTGESGHGLGLRIVEEVAAGHGWEVSVTESEWGGTRFEFTGVATPE